MASIKARLIPAGTLVLRFLPRAVALAAAAVIADLSIALLAARRRAIDDNLVRTAAGADAAERRRLRRQTFRHFAGVWVDFLRVPFLTRRALVDLVHWDTRRTICGRCLLLEPHRDRTPQPDR